MSPLRGRWQRLTARRQRPVARAAAATRSAPHVRGDVAIDRLFATVLLASAPAAVVGAWQAGASRLALAVPDGAAADWRMQLPAWIGLPPVPGVWAVELLVGLAIFLPLLAVAALTSAAWALAFAKARQRAVDPAWLLGSWLFVLLLPPATPPAMPPIIP